MDTLGGSGLTNILLLLIVVLLFAQSWSARLAAEHRDAREHTDRLFKALNEAGDTELDRLVLAEAALAARIDQAIDRLRDMPREQLRVRLADNGYRDVNDEVLDRIRSWLTWDNAKAAGGKLLEKVLGVLNKKFGFAT